MKIVIMSNSLKSECTIYSARPFNPEIDIYLGEEEEILTKIKHAVIQQYNKCGFFNWWGLCFAQGWAIGIINDIMEVNNASTEEEEEIQVRL